MYFKVDGENQNLRAGNLNYNGYGLPIIVVTDIINDEMYQRRLYTDKNKRMYFNFKGNKYFGDWANN